MSDTSKATGHTFHGPLHENVFSNYWFYYPKPGALATLNTSIVGTGTNLGLQFDPESARWLAGELLAYADAEDKIQTDGVDAAEAVIECLEDRPDVEDVLREVHGQ